MQIWYLEPFSGRLDLCVTQARKVALAFPKMTIYLRFNKVAVNVSDPETETDIINDYYRMIGQPR